MRRTLNTHEPTAAKKNAGIGHRDASAKKAPATEATTTTALAMNASVAFAGS